MVNYCQIHNNDHTGIYLCCSSNSNIIHNCDFTQNKKFGVDISVRGTTIYLNNFIDNGIDNGLNARSNQENAWDFEKKGNYWSNYDEPEEAARDTNGDGFVDSPYVIPENNRDYYPFVNQINHGGDTGDTPGFLVIGVLLAIMVVFLSKKYR